MEVLIRMTYSQASYSCLHNIPNSQITASISTYTALFLLHTKYKTTKGRNNGKVRNYKPLHTRQRPAVCAKKFVSQNVCTHMKYHFNIYAQSYTQQHNTSHHGCRAINLLLSCVTFKWTLSTIVSKVDVSYTDVQPVNIPGNARALQDFLKYRLCEAKWISHIQYMVPVI